MTVSDLEAKIKTDRPDLEEINIELYRKDFFQENNVLINTVNSDKPEKRQGVWMDPQKKISQCFSLGEEDFASPFPLEEGKIAGLKPINIIIYPRWSWKKSLPRILDSSESESKLRAIPTGDPLALSIF